MNPNNRGTPCVAGLAGRDSSITGTRRTASGLHGQIIAQCTRNHTALPGGCAVSVARGMRCVLRTYSMGLDAGSSCAMIRPAENVVRYRNWCPKTQLSFDGYFRPRVLSGLSKLAHRAAPSLVITPVHFIAKVSVLRYTPRHESARTPVSRRCRNCGPLAGACFAN